MSQQQRAAVDALLRGAPYDPSTPIADERVTFAQAQTRPFPEAVTARTITLGGRGALDLRIAGDAGAGVLLYLHGGGYVVGSARTGASLAAQLTKRTGTRTVSLDYRLAPEHRFPAAVDDGIAAYRELLDTGVRPEHLVVAGDSAGGGLAIATLLAARDAGLPQPAAAAVFSPWADLTLSGPSMRAKHGVDPLFTRERLRTYAAAYLGDHHGTDDLASPLFADLTGLPPLLVQVGSHEVLLDDAVRLAGAAGAAEVPVTLEVTSGVPHVFQNFTGALDDADEALDRCASFLSQHLRAPAPAMP